MKIMKNPLFPNSKSSGVQKSYETAAFFDDPTRISRKKDKNAIRPSINKHLSTRSKITYREFRLRNSEIVNEYKEKIKELKTMRKNREIDRSEYSKLKKMADKKLVSENSANLEKFI